MIIWYLSENRFKLEKRKEENGQIRRLIHGNIIGIILIYKTVQNLELPGFVDFERKMRLVRIKLNEIF
jgi:hypothetical protein